MNAERTGDNSESLRLGACATLAVCLAMAWSVGADAVSLDDISVTTLPGERVQIKLKLSGPPVQQPSSFTIDNPARIALDFAGTRLNLPAKNQAISVGAARSVSAVEAGGRTRVVVNLVRLVPYDVRVEADAVFVTLQGGGDVAVAGATPARPQATPPSRAAERPGKASITNIDFRRGDNGAARITVTLSDPSLRVDTQEQGGKILVDFIDTQLPERLNRRLDVKDFATPVQEVDTAPHANGARMVISPIGQYEHMAYQSDNLFTVEVKPLTKEEQEAAKKDRYTGERLSLNFQNIEVRAVLQLIADFTGLNLVAADTVSGNVTLRLKNVPWDQALDIILKSKGLGKRQAGNVIMVAPQEEIAAREKAELESSKQLAELAPLHTEFVQINYAKADDLAGLLKAKENKLLSERGNVSVDVRTNTLLIQETAEKLAEMRKIIGPLDIPVRQVLIESRVVIANQSFSRELGVKFGYSKTRGLTRDEPGFSIGGKLKGDTEFGAGTTSFFTDKKDNFIVDLATTATPAGALGLAVGRIGSTLLQLELSALQKEARGEVISSPRVITADQKEAVIESGKDIPYQQFTSSGATNVAFKKAVLSLKVKPHITPDDRIKMDLTVTNDSDSGDRVQGTPIINTNNVSTEAMVDNGETVVLGGVFVQTNNNRVDRVPFFGDLPYLGVLFRHTSVDRPKTELLIFITPKILKESLSISQSR